MAVFLQYNDLTIEIFDDAAFKQTADSPTSYNHIIQVEEDKQYSPTSQHAIKVYQNNEVINDSIILATGGGTGVTENSVLIDDENLVIRCCNKLFSLTLPGLKVNWMTIPDWATCFSVHMYQDTYITHGETAIARIDRAGKTLWSYGGEDIFVCLYEGNPFEMNDDHILLTDFTGRKYKIDYNGEKISYTKPLIHKEELVALPLKPKRPWWKFW